MLLVSYMEREFPTKWRGSALDGGFVDENGGGGGVEGDVPASSIVVLWCPYLCLFSSHIPRGNLKAVHGSQRTCIRGPGGRLGAPGPSPWTCGTAAVFMNSHIPNPLQLWSKRTNTQKFLFTRY